MHDAEVQRSRLLIPQFILLFFVSCYLCIYFQANHSSLHHDIQTILNTEVRQDAVIIGSLRVSPTLTAVHAYGIRINMMDGSPIIIAQEVIARAKPGIIKLANYEKPNLVDIDMAGAQVKNFYLLLEWDANMQFLFVNAFKSGKPPSKKPTKKAPFRLNFDDIKLVKGHIDVKLPVYILSMDVEEASGNMILDRGDLGIKASLKGTMGYSQAPTFVKNAKELELLAPWDKRVAEVNGLQYPMKNLLIDDFVWDDDGFSFRNLSFDMDRSKIRVGGSLHYAEGIEYKADLAINLADEPHILHALASAIAKKQGTHLYNELSRYVSLSSPEPIKGPLSLELKAAGRSAVAQLEKLSISSDALLLYGLPINNLQLSSSIQSDITSLKLNNLRVASKTGEIKATGSFGIIPFGGQDSYTLQVDVTDLKLNQYSRYFKKSDLLTALSPFIGTYDGTVVISGKTFTPVPPTKIVSTLQLKRDQNTYQFISLKGDAPQSPEVAPDGASPENGAKQSEVQVGPYRFLLVRQEPGAKQ